MFDRAYVVGAVAALPLLTAYAPARAQVPALLAVCSDPKGRMFETSPARGWGFDRMKGASLSFTRDRRGQPDVTIRDGVRSYSLRATGAKLTMTHASRDFSYFIITAVHQHAQVDTFQVTFLPNGQGKLALMSVRTHTPPKDETRAGLQVADCSR
jgi:hypothetical protein